jgi:hypothetical protein
VVDLVGDEHKVVAAGEGGDHLQFLRVQTRPPGVWGEQRISILSRPS